MDILQKLTKQYILDRISQEEIFIAFSNITLNELTDCISNNTIICSPLRKDKTPTFGLYYKNGILRGQDFAGYFWGDCFDLVAYHLNLDSNNSHNFNLILEAIAKAFSIHKYGIKEKPKLLIDESLKIEKEHAILQPVIRTWIKKDAEFWKHISRKQLEENGILPLYSLRVNNQLIYSYRENDIGYAYFLGNDQIKVYFPYRKEYKFMGSPVTQGINNFQVSKYGIITKSYKDVQYLRLFRDKYDLDAIAPGSEKIILTGNQIIYLKTMFEYVFSLFDYDNTGIRSGWQYRKRYGIEPLFLRDKVWGRKLGYKGQKDFADVCKNLGLQEAENLINKTIEFYEQQRNDYQQNF